jgi:outer membrane protein
MENKKINPVLILSITAIVISVIALIVTLRKNGDNPQPSSKTQLVSLDSTVNIAYVNLDTLLLEYKYAVKLNEDLLTEQAKAKAKLESRMKSFEKKYNDFAEKMKYGSFLSQSSMESQQKELLKEQNEIEKLNQELTQQLLEKQEIMNKEIYDTVMNFIKEFNKDGKYILILGNGMGSNILYAEPGMNITTPVLDSLNARYSRFQNSK